MTTKWNGGVAVVDDETSLADLIVTMLEVKGMPVCFMAYDGYEAIRKFRECNPKPDVVIMDYRLPAMNGIEVMKEMRQIYDGVKFIFLSADSGVRDEALRAGAVIFLTKPASMKNLVSAVEQVAGK